MKVSPVCLQKHLSMDHLEGYQEQISLLKLVREGFLKALFKLQIIIKDWLNLGRKSKFLLFK